MFITYCDSSSLRFFGLLSLCALSIGACLSVLSFSKARFQHQNLPKLLIKLCLSASFFILEKSTSVTYSLVLLCPFDPVDFDSLEFVLNTLEPLNTHLVTLSSLACLSLSLSSPTCCLNSCSRLSISFWKVASFSWISLRLCSFSLASSVLCSWSFSDTVTWSFMFSWRSFRFSDLSLDMV